MPATAAQPEPPRPGVIGRLLTPLPEWAFVLCGVALIGLVVLVPQWLDNRSVQWERDLMQVQAQRLERQTQRYRDFHAALAADDPVLLERLAYTQLRRVPVGSRVISEAPVDAASLARPAAVTSYDGNIDAWLLEPQPQVGTDVPPHRVIEARLTRVADGSARLGVIAAAALCLLAGLWPRERA